jgi:hypothetical protein
MFVMVIIVFTFSQGLLTFGLNATLPLCLHWGKVTVYMKTYTWICAIRIELLDPKADAFNHC